MYVCEQLATYSESFIPVGCGIGPRVRSTGGRSTDGRGRAFCKR